MSDVEKNVRFHLLGPIQVFAGSDEITITGRDGAGSAHQVTGRLQSMKVALSCGYSTEVQQLDRPRPKRRLPRAGAGGWLRVGTERSPRYSGRPND
jgi:hypothetical protein